MTKNDLRPIKYDLSTNAGNPIWCEGWFHKWTEERLSNGYIIDRALIEQKDGNTLKIDAIKIQFTDR